MKAVEFNLPNMTCESCAEKIEDYAKHAGASNIKFDFKTRNVSIFFDETKTNGDTIKEAILKAGYDVV